MEFLLQVVFLTGGANLLQIAPETQDVNYNISAISELRRYHYHSFTPETAVDIMNLRRFGERIN